jgi:NADH-quinone oxidoreductase subunit D
MIIDRRTGSRPEHLRTDLTSWVVGPYHGALPGPMRVHLKLDGEVVVAGVVETGFLHRGLEKALELHPWRSTIPYMDHLDPESAVFGELVLCLAVEEIVGIVVPPRAQRIRVILAELTRLSCHLGFIARVARAVGSDTMLHYVLRDREKVLDLLELQTGSRASLNFLRFGGVVADVTEGFMERVHETVDMLRVRLKEYNDLFTFNRAFVKRTANVGIISSEFAKHLGISGPNARAAGLPYDVRKSYPYCGYDQLDFHIPLGKGEGGTQGDSLDRFLLRLREIALGIDLLKQAVESLPRGPFWKESLMDNFEVPAGEAYVRVESPRGMLGCHLVSDGGKNPSRVQFRVPTLPLLQAVPDLLVGGRLEDLPVILASLDLGIAEADR